MTSWMQINVRVLAGKARAVVGGLQAQMAGLSAATNRAAAAPLIGARQMPGLVKFGNQMQWTGRQIQYNFTLPLLLAAGAATKWELENEKAMTHVAKVYGDTQAAAKQFRKENSNLTQGMAEQKATKVFRGELSALDKAFVAISNHYGVQQSEVLKVAGAWAAAGVSGRALADSVNLTMQAVIIGDMDAAAATKSLISIQAQYNLSSKELSQTLAQLNAVENATGIDMQGLIQGFERSAGVARDAGISTRYLAAMLAALVPSTGSAAQAGNALKTIISRLLAPTKQAADILGEMGIQVSDTSWQSLTFTERLGLLQKQYSKLSGPAKAYASSFIASRYQINKFTQLMNELGPSFSYYEKALDATSSKGKAFSTMQKELNAVLNSNPQKLKQIWTILQNAMADVITPMIPYLLYLVNGIKNMVTWFGNLNPVMQHVALSGLLWLAVIGPMLRYMGSSITLIGTMGRALLTTARFLGIFRVSSEAAAGSQWLLRGGLLGVLKSIVLAPFRLAILAIQGIGIAALWTAKTTLPYLAKQMWAAALMVGKSALFMARMFTMTFVNSVRVGAIRVLGTMALMWGAMLNGARVALGRLVATSVLAFSGIVTGAMAMMRTVAISLAAGVMTGVGLVAEGAAAVVGAVSAPVVAIIAAVMAVVFIFRKQIVQVWNNIVSYFQGSGSGIVDFFNSIVNSIIGVFYKLPQGVQNAMMAVVNVVHDAAMAVYNLFSYINPFAHHSPSLVDNVTKGMLEVNRQFATLSNIGKYTKAAYAEVSRFGKLTARLGISAAAMQQAQDRATIKKAGGGAALGSYDRLIKLLRVLTPELKRLEAAQAKQQVVVNGWKNKVDDANWSLDVQQKKLDSLQKTLDGYQGKLDEASNRLQTFASTPLQGMQAMEDQIHANSYAQTVLQYQMMQMSDVTGTIDQVRSKLEALQGAQEILRGEAGGLRAAGAGSDVLKGYDDQIKALDSQRTEYEKNASALTDMQAKLTALQNEAAKLDLTKAMKFDDLQYQIERAANTMKEMPFDQIMAGMQAAQADIAVYSQKVDTASAAVAKQQAIVDKLTASRDKLQNSLDAEQHKLDLVTRKYDQVNNAVQAINQSISDVVDNAGKMNDKLNKAHVKKKADLKGPKAPAISDTVKGFRAAKKGSFPDVGGKGLPIRTDFSSQTKGIDDFTKGLAGDTAKMFGDLNPFGGVKKKAGAFFDWIKGQFDKFSAWASGLFGHMFDGVSFGDAGSKIKSSFSGIRDFITSVMKSIGDAVGAVWRLLGPDIMKFIHNTVAGFKDFFNKVAPVLASFGPLIKPFGQAIANVWTIAKPILVFIAMRFLFLAKVIASVLANTIRPALSAIGGIIAGVLTTIRGVFEIIIGIFTLNGPMIVKGIEDMFLGPFKTAIAFLKGVGGIIWGIVKGIVEGIIGFFKWLYNEMVGHSIIPDLINGIIYYFKLLGSIPKWIWDHMLKPVINFFQNAWTAVKKAVGFWWTGIMIEWGVLKAAGAWVWNNVLKPVIDRFKNAWTNVKDLLAGWWDGMKNALSGLKNIGGWIKTNVMDPVFNAIKTGWNKVQDWLSNSKDMLVKPAHAIVNAVANAVNVLIRGLNKVSDILPGISFHIDPIPGFAKGTDALPRRRVSGGFKTTGARAIVGEGKANHPEFVIPTDPTHRRRATGLLMQAASKMGLAGTGMRNRGTWGDSPKDIAKLSRNVQGAVPEYALGGILSHLNPKNLVKGAASWMKGNIHKLATQIYNPIASAGKNAINKRAEWIPKGEGIYGINKFGEWIGAVDGEMAKVAGQVKDNLGGGPRVKKAQRWAKGEVGKPYVWGGVGPGGYDCSGFQSAITNILRNKSPHSRVGATASFPWGGFSNGYGGKNGYTIGSTKNYGGSGIGHMAGTLGGLNVESRGGQGVVVGSSARGYNDGGFNIHAHLGTGAASGASAAIKMGNGGIAKARRGGVFANIAESGNDEAVVPLPRGWKSKDTIGSTSKVTENHFHDSQFVFPNITDPNDAQRFIENLEILAKD